MARNKELIITMGDEGQLEMINAKTIDIYLSLKGGYGKLEKKTETDKILANDAYYFAAFNKEQFKEGYDKMKPHLKEGEKIISVGYGCYFSRTGLDLFKQAQKSMRQRIKEECDPQEVYCYEYNNHECMFSHDDDNVMALITDYFGKRVANSIQRGFHY